jgi:hypothetical protein
VACEPIHATQGSDGWDEVVAVWAMQLAHVLGADVMRELTRFTRMEVPGAQVTIRRTRDGLTAQVTGPIVGGRRRDVTLELVEELIRDT